MPTRDIEFHDSTLLSVSREGDEVCIRLQAYVHEWDGERGPHTGWTQAVELRVKDVRADGQVTEGIWLSTGDLSVSGDDYDLVPLPFEGEGSVRLRLENGGGVLTLTGTQIRVRATGPAKFVELCNG